MTVKRTLTLIFGLIIVSILAKQLVWYMNPPSRLHGVGYEYIYSPLNYIQFFVLFLIPSSAAFFLYRLDSKILNKFYDRASAAVKKMFLAGLESKEVVLSFAIVMFWIFNLMENAFFRYLVENPNPFRAPFDPHHEGEKIGFLYTFLNSNEPLKDIFFEHGYIVEVLTSYLAYLIAPENHALITFRFLFTLQTLLSWLGVIWVIWEIVNFTDKEEDSILTQVKFIIFSVVLVLGSRSFISLGYQSSVFFFQLGLVLHLLKKLTHSNPSRKFVFLASFFIGLSIPLGPLYSTKYGLIFSAIFVFTVALLFFYEQRKFLLLGASLGFFSSGIAIILVLGWSQILEVGRVFLYLIEFIPIRFSRPFISDATEHYLWIPQLVIGVIIICGVQLVINFKQSDSFHNFIRNNAHIIFLLLSAVSVVKIALDTSDWRHFKSITPQSLLLFFALVSSWVDRATGFKLFIITSYNSYKTTWVLVLIFLVCINTNPNEAFRHVKPYWKHVSITDDVLIGNLKNGYLAAVKEMEPEIQNMKCFYTLTSESSWYYYFKKPSCSRHHILLWAIPKEASDEIVDSLRSKSPEVILFSNDNSNKRLVTSHLNPEVYHFIYQNYRPYKLVGSHWFWKRSPGGMEGAPIVELDFSLNMSDPIYSNAFPYDAHVALDGILRLKNIYNIDALYVTQADEGTPLAVAVNDGSMTRINSEFIETKWSIKVPMVNILSEIKKYQLWGYSSKKHESIKIGESFKIDHSKVDIGSNYVRS